MSERSIEFGNEPLYAIVLRAQMRASNLTLDQAYKKFLEEAENGPGGGKEHLPVIKEAYEYLKSQNER